MIRLLFLIFLLYPATNLAAQVSVEDDYSIMNEYFNEEAQEKENNDPLESLNRKVFAFNKFTYEYGLKYIIDAYEFITPDFLERGFKNFFTNLEKPYVTIVSLLKMDPNNAGIAFSTFIVNITFGLFGFMDLTSQDGIVYDKVGFDDMLGFYKIPKGPYLVLPFLGPSTLRGAAASGLGYSFNIYTKNTYLEGDLLTKDKNYISYMILKNLVKLSGFSNHIDDIYNNSIDPYVILKSYYMQRK